MVASIRTLIVDDEHLARQRVRSLLRGEEDIEVIDECSTGREAASAIERLSPQLVFLDVQLPEMDAFDVLRAAKFAESPLIIFVTAYAEHAVRAFDAHALDYLLKPIDRERFAEAVERARRELMRRSSHQSASEGLAHFLQHLQRGSPPAQALPVRMEGRIKLVPLQTVDWIESCGKYVYLHCGPQTHLMRDSISRVEARLAPAQFVRIHRCTIVRLDAILDLEPVFRGQFLLHLRDGTQLTLSRGYRREVCRRLGVTES